MRKAEAEPIVRVLCHDWASEQNNADLIRPSVWSFRSWMDARGYGHYLQFRSVGGPYMAAEMWFDAELKETRLRATLADMEGILADLAAPTVSVAEVVPRLQRHAITNREHDALRELREAGTDGNAALIDKVRTTFEERYRPVRS